MLKSKKGDMFMLLWFFLVIALLGFTLFALFTGEENVFKDVIGGHSVKLLKVYSETEKELFYFETVGEISTINALLDMLENPTGEDMHNGYFYLRKEGENLLVDDLEEEFKKRVLENIKGYTSDINYLLEFEDGFELKGLGNYSADEFVDLVESNMSINYSVVSFFKVVLEFSFEEFKNDLSEIDGVYNLCILEEDKLNCLEDGLKDIFYVVKVEKENDNLFIVEITTPDKIDYGFGEKEVIYRIALDYSSPFS